MDPEPDTNLTSSTSPNLTNDATDVIPDNITQSESNEGNDIGQNLSNEIANGEMQEDVITSNSSPSILANDNSDVILIDLDGEYFTNPEPDNVIQSKSNTTNTDNIESLSNETVNETQVDNLNQGVVITSNSSPSILANDNSDVILFDLDGKYFTNDEADNVIQSELREGTDILDSSSTDPVNEMQENNQNQNDFKLDDNNPILELNEIPNDEKSQPSENNPDQIQSTHLQDDSITAIDTPIIGTTELISAEDQVENNIVQDNIQIGANTVLLGEDTHQSHLEESNQIVQDIPIEPVDTQPHENEKDLAPIVSGAITVAETTTDDSNIVGQDYTNQQTDDSVILPTPENNFSHDLKEINNVTEEVTQTTYENSNQIESSQNLTPNLAEESKENVIENTNETNQGITNETLNQIESSQNLSISPNLAEESKENVTENTDETNQEITHETLNQIESSQNLSISPNLAEESKEIVIENTVEPNQEIIHETLNQIESSQNLSISPNLEELPKNVTENTDDTNQENIHKISEPDTDKILVNNTSNRSHESQIKNVNNKNEQITSPETKKNQNLDKPIKRVFKRESPPSPSNTANQRIQNTLKNIKETRKNWQISENQNEDTNLDTQQDQERKLQLQNRISILKENQQKRESERIVKQYGNVPVLNIFFDEESHNSHKVQDFTSMLLQAFGFPGLLTQNNRKRYAGPNLGIIPIPPLPSPYPPVSTRVIPNKKYKLEKKIFDWEGSNLQQNFLNVLTLQVSRRLSGKGFNISQFSQEKAGDHKRHLEDGVAVVLRQNRAAIAFLENETMELRAKYAELLKSQWSLEAEKEKDRRALVAENKRLQNENKKLRVELRVLAGSKPRKKASTPESGGVAL